MPALWKSVMISTYVQSWFLEAEYTLRRILQMHVGATNTPTEQKSVSILEMISKRNEGQSCYMTNLYVRLCITLLLPIFHWRMHGSRSRWSFHLLNTDLLSAYYVPGTVLNKHWGHNRDKQHKDSGSVASTAEDLHKKYNRAEGNTCEGRAHSSPGARKVLWEKWAAEKWRMNRS